MTTNNDISPGGGLAGGSGGRHVAAPVARADSMGKTTGSSSAVLTPEPLGTPGTTTTPAVSAGARPPLLRRVVRGRPEDPAWIRPALWLILAGTAVLYLWDLGASHWGNDFYAAAVQSGTKNWTAFFFGSSDWGNSITVDKPPASLWVMEISGRIFGFNSWSMLAPEAIEGVLAVFLLYAAVRRWAGAVAGLAAAAILAVTPVAVLMFRYNNTDALLTLLEVAAAYCIVRAFDEAATRAGTRWIVLAGVLMGFAFLTKTLAAFLVMPAFALVYLLFAPVGLWRRVRQLLFSGAGLVVGAGWWLLATVLWPVDGRPYFGGSGDNTALGLAFGYNGVARISGNGNGIGGGGVTSGFGGSTGLTRLFSSEIGSQIAWLLPTALVALVAGLWVTRRAPRIDRARAGLVLWGGWTLVTAGVFSYMQGIFHPYYNIALAPGIAALVAVGVRELWLVRDQIAARIGLAVLVGVTAVMAFTILGRVPNWNPWLRWAIVVAAVVSAVALVAGARALRRFAVIGLAVGAVAGLAGPAAYAIDTAGTPSNGAVPSAGPAAAGGGGGRGGAMGGGSLPGGMTPQDLKKLFGGNVPGGTGGIPNMGGTSGSRRAGGGMPGMGGNDTVNSAVIALLKKSTTKWAAATVSSQSASSLQLNSDKAVIPIGGFSGSDPAPTLAQFKKWVAAGQINYYVGMSGGSGMMGGLNPGKIPGGATVGGNRGGMGGLMGNRGTSTSIGTWVTANYTSMTVGGETVYDLTKPLKK